MDFMDIPISFLTVKDGDNNPWEGRDYLGTNTTLQYDGQNDEALGGKDC